MATHKRISKAIRNGPVRRKLFGPVDKEQLQAEYQAAMGGDLEEASQRWGFDFISDTPLEGSHFQWECIPVAKLPQFYRSSCSHGLGNAEGQRAAEAAVKPKAGGGRRAGSSQSEKENIPCLQEKCALNPKKMEKTPESRENTGLKRKQTNITDFYPAKRRVAGMPLKSGE